MNKEVVKELIQNDLTTKNIKKELNNILEGPKRAQQIDAYSALEKKLGGKGASENTAKSIIRNIPSK